MVSTTEGITNNVTMLMSAYGITKNPSARKQLRHFSDLFDVK